MRAKIGNSSIDDEKTDQSNIYRYFYFIGGGFGVIFSLINLILILIPKSPLTGRSNIELLDFFNGLNTYGSSLSLPSIDSAMYEILPLILGIGAIIISIKRLTPIFAFSIGYLFLLPSLFLLFLANYMIPGILILIGAYLHYSQNNNRKK